MMVVKAQALLQPQELHLRILGLSVFAPVVEEHVLQQDDLCEDLTLHDTDSSQFAHSYVRVLSMDLLKPKLPDSCSRGALDAFDLTYSDDNADWTLCNSPSWSISSNDGDLPQVRAMVDATSPVEIILDSGADISALPMQDLWQRWCGSWTA